MPTIQIPARERLAGWLYEAARLYITEIDGTRPDASFNNEFLAHAERAWHEAYRDVGTEESVSGY